VRARFSGVIPSKSFRPIDGLHTSFPSFAAATIVFSLTHRAVNKGKYQDFLPKSR